MSLEDQLAECRVLPVITPLDADSTVELCRALAAGGMRCMEITLRSPAALDSLRAVKAALPELLLAAGTVTKASHVEQAVDAGAQLCLSPGISQPLLQACAEVRTPFIPGVATASEIMLGLDHGLDVFKYFPASLGGPAALKAFAGPFPDVKFCPTGGLNPDNFREYLALPNVLCCGGSWMVGRELVEGARWEEIEQLARQAVAG